MPATEHVNEGTVSARTWAWLLLGLTLAAAATVAAFNAVVDPTAQLGTGILEPVAAGARDRAAKVELLEPVDPELVVLGSSRTKKLDPAWLVDGEAGFNAAVVGGDLFEARVFAAWLDELDDTSDSGRSGTYPQLVVGIDVEQLRDSSLQGSGFLDVPQVAHIARREAAGADGSLAGELDRLERLLLTWQVTKASAASVRARVQGQGATSTGEQDAAREAARVDEFTVSGVPLDDARWLDPAVAERRAVDTPARIEANVQELRATYDANGARLDPDAVNDLRALVRIAREAGGPPPLLYVTPGNSALSALDPLGRAERQAAVLELLERIARPVDRNGRPAAIAVDCSACIDDEATSWIDATHPSPLGMRQLADALGASLASA